MRLYPFLFKISVLLLIFEVGLTGIGLTQPQGGDILVVDLTAGTGGAGALFSVNPANGVRILISDFGLSTQGPLGMNPVGVAVEQSGDVLVVVFSRLLFRVDPATGIRTILSNFSNASQGPVGAGPGGVAVDSAGNILVADKLTNVVFRVDPVTGNRTIVSNFSDSTQGSTGLDPFGSTMDKSGMLFVTDQTFTGGARGALFRVNPATGARILVSNFADSSKGPLGKEPNGLDIDASGKVVVADLMAGAGSVFNNIGVLFGIDPATGDRTLITDFSDPTHGALAHSPVGVSIDQAGQILTATMNGAASAAKGLLLKVDPATGFRTILSDFGDASQGPLGQDPFDIAIVPVEDVSVSVEIDIKPGGGDNSINRRAKGVVPVALLGSTEFQVTSADWRTVTFAGASPLNIGYGFQDINGDDLLDAVFHFNNQSLNLPDGTTEACLTGATSSGLNFQGCGPLKLVK